MCPRSSPGPPSLLLMLIALRLRPRASLAMSWPFLLLLWSMTRATGSSGQSCPVEAGSSPVAVSAGSSGLRVLQRGVTLVGYHSAAGRVITRLTILHSRPSDGFMPKQARPVQGRNGGGGSIHAETGKASARTIQ